MINGDPWWDDPAYKAAQGTFPDRGAFAKLKAQDAEKLQEVLTDLYRNAIPAPEDITRFPVTWVGCRPGSTA